MPQNGLRITPMALACGLIAAFLLVRGVQGLADGHAGAGIVALLLGAVALAGAISRMRTQ